MKLDLRRSIKKGITFATGSHCPEIDTFYLNLLVQDFTLEKGLILLTRSRRDVAVNEMNKICYGDERKSRFLNYTFYENATDSQDILYLVKKHLDVRIVVLPNYGNIHGDKEAMIKELAKIAEDNFMSILIMNYISRQSLFNENLDVNLLSLALDTKEVISSYLFLEPIEVEGDNHQLAIKTVFNKEEKEERTQKYYFDTKHSRLYRRIPNGEASIEKKGLEEVVGFEEIKKELLLIKSWLEKKEGYSLLNIDLPKGLILYGPPGTGKTYFLKNFVSGISNCAVVEIGVKGDLSSVKDIADKFEYARLLSPQLTFIVIDEIDYCSRSEEKELITQLDGFSGDNSNIFVLATCNDFNRLSEALTRRGRLDYTIGLGFPDFKDRKEILSYYINRYGLKETYDMDYLSSITEGSSTVTLNAICNETRLRYGENATVENFESVVDKIDKRQFEFYGESGNHDDYLVAIHEVSHAIVAYQHQNYFKFYKATIESNSKLGGVCKFFSIAETGSLDKELASIEIAMAGYLGCKILKHYLDKGSLSDLEKVRHSSAALVNTYGYAGFNRLINHDSRFIAPSSKKMEGNEKLSELILITCEKRVTKLIKKNKKRILHLADMLVEKRILTFDDLKNVLG